MRGRLIVALLLTTALAGCFGEVDDLPPAKSEASDWYAMSMTAGPDRPLQAFEWTLPEGGVFESPTGRMWTILEVLVVPEDEEDTLPDGLVVAGFARVGDGAQTVGWLSLTSWHDAWREDTNTETQTWEARPSGYLRFLYPPLVPGDPVYLVVGAEAKVPTNFKVVFRSLPGLPDEAAAESLPSFEAKVTGERPEVLAPLGSGIGYADPWYIDINSFRADPGGIGIYGAWEGWNDDVDLQENAPVDMRPYGAVREVTTSYEFPSKQGWGVGTGYYIGNLPAGEWSADVDLHGVSLSASRPLTSDLPGLVLGSYYNDTAGYSGYILEGGGEGPGSATFKVAEAAATGIYDYITFIHLEFGATLAQLIGLPSVPRQGVWPPDSPTAPTLLAGQVVCAQLLQRAEQVVWQGAAPVDGSWAPHPLEQAASRVCPGPGHGSRPGAVGPTQSLEEVAP